MKSRQPRFLERAAAVAVRSALATMALIPTAYGAEPMDPLVAELVKPISAVELGIGYVTEDSFKFGEYNGLQNKGPYVIGNFDLRGGAPYDSPGTFRWRAFGNNVGLENRTIGGEVGNQGSFRLRYQYDELRRNQYDNYQTFYRGAGGRTLDIPAFADIPAAQRVSSTATAAGALSNWQNIQSPYATAACATTGGIPTPACAGPGYRIPAAMQDFDVSTKRKKHDLDFTQELGSGFQFKASVNHQEKDGTKLTGVAFGGPARGVLVPEVIDYKTDYLRASLGWVGQRAYATIGYTGSQFRNGTNLWLVENPFNGSLLNPEFGNFAHMVGAPDNEMHQLSVSGGYNFSSATKLMVSGNWQRMTQNEAFTALPSTWTLPESSPNAKVINSDFLARLTSKPTRELQLMAQYRYEDRDNKTPSQNFLVAGGDAAGTPSLFTNRPLNFKTHSATVEGDYYFAPRQAVKLGYDYKEIERTVTAEPPPPAELESPFRAEKTKENTFRAEYRNNLAQKLTGRLMYAYSTRRASEYEEFVLLPQPTVAPFPAADPLLPGFREAFLSDRDRNKFKGVLNAQASDALTLNGSIEWNHDKYKNLLYGLKKNESLVFNLDAGYALNENTGLSAFYTYEHRNVGLDLLAIGRGTAATILDAPAFTQPCSGFFAAAGHLPSDVGTDPCRRWGEDYGDRVHTFGMGANMRSLFTERFDLIADLTYQYAKTPINVTGGTYFGNGSTAPAPAFNNIFIPSERMPDILTKYFQLRLNGTYAIDRKSAIRVLYIFGHLKTDDWQWDAYTNSRLGVLAVPVYPGTNITSPDYNVHVIGISYVHYF